MLSLGKLAAMAPEERARALRTMKPNGIAIDGQIRKLEQRHEMTSETMRTRVAAGELDTADTSRWLVLLAARGR